MKIPLTIHSNPGAAALPGGEPVTFGVPLPRGAVSGTPSSWRVDWSQGHTAEADVRALDRWSDGSVRWALVDARLPSQAAHGAALDTDHVPPAMDPGIAIEETGDTLRVDTGPVRFDIRRGGPMPFGQVNVGAASVATDGGPGLTISDQHGATVAVAVSTFDVTHRSRLRVAVRLDGRATLGGGRVVLVTMQVEFYAGLGVARVLSTIRNPDAARHPGNFWDLGDPGSILLKDVSIGLTLPSLTPNRAVQASLAPGETWTTYTGTFDLLQDSSGGDAWQSSNHLNRLRVVPNTFRGYRLRAGSAEVAADRATPIVVNGDVAAWQGVVVPYFWQNFPCAIDARDARLTLHLLPGTYADLHELQGGEQKTQECFLAFGTGTPSGAQLEWCRSRAVVAAEPGWAMTSGGVGFVGPLDAGHSALVQTAIEGPDCFEAKREIIDEYGWRHFGEVYGDHEAIGHQGPTPLVSHYNNQYDPVAGFALQFVRTGDPRWWRAMSELAWHVIDIDIYHTDRDKSAYNGGLFWHTYHYGDVDTATHRTYPVRGKGKTFGGGPSADHNYPSGLMLYYFLTGHEPAREAAIGLAEYVISLDDGRLSMFRWLSHADTGGAIATAPAFFGPARASGNSLNALVDGHRLTDDARFLRKAEQLIRRVVHPEDVIAKNQLDEPEIRWFYAMFMQALGKYLHHRAERGFIDDEYAYGRATLLHYARWMADHEYPYLDRPEKLEFPTETWAAQDIRKSDIFHFAAMHADGPERDRFLERAAFFHRNSVETLSAMPTRALARPVIVMLTSGFMQGWFGTQRAPTEPRPTSHGPFGTPQTFVPQRVIAMRRAKLLAAAIAVSGLAAVVALAIWLLR
ncbi:MAG: hypothetical protein ABI634_15125 [Acidobacteriota bacterium]